MLRLSSTSTLAAPLWAALPPSKQQSAPQIRGVSTTQSSDLGLIGNSGPLGLGGGVRLSSSKVLAGNPWDLGQ